MKTQSNTEYTAPAPSEAAKAPLAESATSGAESLPIKGGQFTYDESGALVPYTPPTQE